MLESAHCGVRIRQQASEREVYDKNGMPLTKDVKAKSDFIISNFFQIEQLMFAHGYNSHLQISRLIYFYFYKNVILVAAEVTFQCFSGFSREQFFITIFISLYNFLLTTIQSIVAILMEDRYLNADYTIVHPSLYMANL